MDTASLSREELIILIKEKDNQLRINNELMLLYADIISQLTGCEKPKGKMKVLK